MTVSQIESFETVLLTSFFFFFYLFLRRSERCPSKKGLQKHAREAAFIYLLMDSSKCSFNFQHAVFTCISGATTTWGCSATNNINIYTIITLNTKRLESNLRVHFRCKKNKPWAVKADYGFNFLRGDVRLFYCLFSFGVFSDCQSCGL